MEILISPNSTPSKKARPGLVFFKTLLLGMVLLGTAALSAEETKPPQNLFENGNKAYEQGNFALARDSYEQIIRRGRGSAELYFNLGNAYYRLGKLGKARLWYERAELKKPGDEDVQHNLELVRAQIQEPQEGSNFIEEMTALWPVILWILFLANAAFFATLSVGLLSDKEWIWWGRWVTGLLFSGMLVLTLVLNSPHGQGRGVILEPRAEIRTGPGEDYRVGFTAPEGQKVLLFETRNGWVQVGVPEKGLKGWVKQSAVETISLEIQTK